MAGHESTVVEPEERYEKELAEVFDGLRGANEGDFEDAVESGDEVFGPVEQKDPEGIPSEEQAPHRGTAFAAMRAVTETSEKSLFDSLGIGSVLGQRLSHLPWYFRGLRAAVQ